MTPREAALHAAVQEAFSHMVAGEYERVRSESETVFRDVRRDGTTQLEVLLPDGTPIGKISIKAGGAVETVDDPLLLKWAAERNPEAIEEHVDSAALRDPAVIACLKERFPELVSPRVRTATREAYLKEARKQDGWLRDETDGEQVQVLTSAPVPATGAFAFTGGKADQRRAAIMDAIRAGDPVVRQIAFGSLLALPAAGGGDGD